MIVTFRDKKTQSIWSGEFVRHLPTDIQKTARRKLRMINNANSVSDLASPPSNCLELLKGDKKGYYSIRVNNQWRICFLFENNNAYEVTINDYH